MMVDAVGMDTHAPAFRALVAQAVVIVGSQPKLAKLIGRSQQQVSALCTRADFISAEDALAIDIATDGQVQKSALRPDLWPPERRDVQQSAEAATS